MNRHNGIIFYMGETLSIKSSGKWRRFLRNPRASASAALLAVIFAVSLFGGAFLPPPGEITDPASLEPHRRLRVRIVPEVRSGRIDISPAMAVAAETGAAAFSPALTNGAEVASALPLPADALTAISNRFANLASPAASFAVALPDGTEAALSLAEYAPRAMPPRTVRLRLRDTDAAAARRTISFTLKRDDPRAAEYESNATLEPVAWPFRPVPGHPCGIDAAGRDVLARIVAGTRIALLFGLVLVASSMALGIAVGAVQGYFGGVVDIASQRLIEIWSALPFLYVMMLVGSVVGRSFALLLLCYGLFNWIGISYYMRAEFLRLRSRPFVDAARCQGFSTLNIMMHHILPNALTPVITLLPFSLIGAIASISALDFLGFGLPPLTPSLGELLGQAQQNTSAWWLALYPALVLFMVMLLSVFVGEGLRDAFDPKPAARYE